MNSINIRYRGRAENAPDLLKDLGVSEALAVLATPQLFLTPVVTDPDAQATMITVQAIQRGLEITANGVLNRSTADALRRIAGERWANRTWGQLVGDVVAYRRRRALRQHFRNDDLSGIDSPFATTAVVAAGVAVAFLIFSGARR